jgi:hypothetical protein
MKLLAVVLISLGLVGCGINTPLGDVAIDASGPESEPVVAAPLPIVIYPGADPEAGNLCPGIAFEDELEIMYRLVNPRTVTIAASPSLNARYGRPTVTGCALVIDNWIQDKM